MSDIEIGTTGWDALNELLTFDEVPVWAHKFVEAGMQEIDRLRAELDSLRKQEPACVIDVNRHGDGVLVAGSLERGIHKLYAASVPPAADDTIERATKYAHDIVTWLHRDHYADNTAFEPFSDLLGLLSQIDNMICGWKEQPAAVAVPDVPWVITVESSEVYSPSGKKWKDMVAATHAPVAPSIGLDIAAAIDSADYVSPRLREELDIPPFLRRNPENAPSGKRLCECGKAYVPAPVAQNEPQYYCSACRYIGFTTSELEAHGGTCSHCNDGDHIHEFKSWPPHVLPAAPVAQKVPYGRYATESERFEAAIRSMGIVSACEWFGHSPDSTFTKDTIAYFAEKDELLAAAQAQEGK